MTYLLKLGVTAIVGCAFASTWASPALADVPGDVQNGV
jgi:hypothetical protein